MASRRRRARTHEDLEEGAYDPHGTGRHSCASCRKLELKQFVGESRDIRVRQITFRCPDHDQAITRFTIQLENLRRQLGSVVFPICRFCSWHQNHHIHYYDKLVPHKEVGLDEIDGPINDSKAMLKAHAYSYDLMYNQFEGLVRRWLSRWKKRG